MLAGRCFQGFSPHKPQGNSKKSQALSEAEGDLLFSLLQMENNPHQPLKSHPTHETRRVWHPISQRLSVPYFAGHFHSRTSL
jgi:hypothetical protein